MNKVPLSCHPGLFKRIMTETGVRSEEERDKLISWLNNVVSWYLFSVSVISSLIAFRQEIRNQEAQLSYSIPGYSENLLLRIPDPPDQFSTCRSLQLNIVLNM